MADESRMDPTEAVSGAGKRRRELGAAMAELELAVAAPMADPRWRGHVGEALEEVADAFRVHCEEVERPDGMFEEVLTEAPRLDRSVDWFRADHERLYAGIDEMTGAVAAAEPQAVREGLTNLLADLVRHRQRGADLVYEAYSVDIGGW